MSVEIERITLYQSIKTLPDKLLPDLAEFIAFLQLKAQQKVSVQEILLTNTGVETKPATFAALQNDTLEKAAQTLLDDYLDNQELTAFISLGGEDFYA